MSRIITIEHPEPNAEHVNFETTVEFNWTIRNWVQLSTTEKVFEYVQEFHLVSSGGVITSKWLLGFEKRPTSVMGPYVKLLDVTGCCVCEGSVEMFSIKRDGGVQQVFVPNECIAFPEISWSTSGTFLSWREYLNENNEFVQPVKLHVLYKEFRHNINPVQRLQNFQKSQLSCLIGSMQKLRTKPGFNNLTLLCQNNVKLEANRDILACRSGVIESHLSILSTESHENVLEFPDVSSAVMEILVKLWYTGQLDGNWSSRELIENFVLAAKKFEFVELLQYLDEVLGDEKLVTSSVSLLELAVKVGLKTAAQQLTRNIARKAANLNTVDEMLSLLGRAQCQESSNVKKTLPCSSMASNTDSEA